MTAKTEARLDWMWAILLMLSLGTSVWLLRYVDRLRTPPRPHSKGK